MSSPSYWTDFKLRTGIHGFAEYGGMRSAIARILLVLVCLTLSVFCGYQIYRLCDEYAQHKSTTTVEVSRTLELPDIGIILAPDNYFAAINKAGVVNQSLLELVTRTWAEEEGTGMPCPEPIEINGEVAGEKPEGDQEGETPQEDGEGDPEGDDEPGISAASLNNYQPKFEDVQKFIKEFKKSVPTPAELFREVRVKKRKSEKNITLKFAPATITTMGPLYRLRTSTVVASQVDRVEIDFHSDSLNDYYHLVFGTNVNLNDPAPSISLDGSKTNIVDVRFVHYFRTKRYCDDENSKEWQCLTKCVLDGGWKAAGCVPYLGERQPSGYPICRIADGYECFEMYHKCESLCDHCDTCRPCREVFGSSATARDVSEGSPNQKEEEAELPKTTTLTINFPGGAQVQRFIQQEAYSGVSFLSQLGGSLGLCFGISIVSIYHLIYSLFVMAGEGMRKIGNRGVKDDEFGLSQG